MKMKISLSSVFFLSRALRRKAPRVFAAAAFPDQKNYFSLFPSDEMKTSRKSVEALMVSMRWSFLFWWLRLDGVRDDMRSGHQTTASDKCTSLNKSSLRARRRCVEISFEIFFSDFQQISLQFRPDFHGKRFPPARLEAEKLFRVQRPPLIAQSTTLCFGYRPTQASENKESNLNGPEGAFLE